MIDKVSALATWSAGQQHLPIIDERNHIGVFLRDFVVKGCAEASLIGQQLGPDAFLSKTKEVYAPAILEFRMCQLYQLIAIRNICFDSRYRYGYQMSSCPERRALDRSKAFISAGVTYSSWHWVNRVMRMSAFRACSAIAPRCSPKARQKASLAEPAMMLSQEFQNSIHSQRLRTLAFVRSPYHKTLVQGRYAQSAS